MVPSTTPPEVAASRPFRRAQESRRALSAAMAIAVARSGATFTEEEGRSGHLDGPRGPVRSARALRDDPG